MSCRQRQRDELRALCRDGAVARAVDLAFGHFAAYGRDDGIVGLLAEAIEAAGASPAVRRRFTELRALPKR
jgi:hypothetical protein